MPESTMVKLREEAIERPEGMVELNDKYVDIVVEALRKSVGLVPSGSGTRASLMSATGVRM